MQQYKAEGQYDIHQSGESRNLISLQGLIPLIKCVKDRQAQYFQLLNFITKNINSSSSEIDQISLFDRFARTIKAKQHQLIISENSILANTHNQCHNKLILHSVHQQSKSNQQNREVLRLCSRIIQILQNSIGKSKNTIINQNNKLYRQYTLFKNQLQKTFTSVSTFDRTNKQQTINTYHFAKSVLNYTKQKFKRELDKIQRYLEKLQSGQCVYFRQIIYKNNKGSDISQQSASQIKNSPHKSKNYNGSPQSPQKKLALKKTNSKHKNRSMNKKEEEKNQNQVNSDCSQIQIPKKTKTGTAVKLYKFYALLELNKKQFMEDLIFQKNQQQIQRAKIMSTLIQRNKLIKDQIGQYLKKTINFQQHTKQFSLNLQAQQSHLSRNQSSVNSKVSMRTSFVIKRKTSFHIEHSDVQQSNTDKQPQQELHSKLVQKLKHQYQNPQKKVRSIITPRRHSNSNNNDKKSKQGLFIVKPPVIFQDEMIPKVTTTQNAWTQNSLTNRQKDLVKRKNQHIRLKKRNNPCPLQNTFLPESLQNGNLRYHI